MNRRLALVLVAASVVSIGGIFAYEIFESSENQEDVRDAADSAKLQSCKDIRKNICLTTNIIREENYPKSCFKDEENILKEPYKCQN